MSCSSKWTMRCPCSYTLTAPLTQNLKHPSVLHSLTVALSPLKRISISFSLATALFSFFSLPLHVGFLVSNTYWTRRPRSGFEIENKFVNESFFVSIFFFFPEFFLLSFDLSFFFYLLFFRLEFFLVFFFFLFLDWVKTQMQDLEINCSWQEMSSTGFFFFSVVILCLKLFFFFLDFLPRPITKLHSLTPPSHHRRHRVQVNLLEI